MDRCADEYRGDLEDVPGVAVFAKPDLQTPFPVYDGDGPIALQPPTWLILASDQNPEMGVGSCHGPSLHNACGADTFIPAWRFNCEPLVVSIPACGIALLA